MKVIDETPVKQESGTLGMLQDRVNQLLQSSLGGNADRKAQQVVIEQLKQVLDNRHFMLTNVSLEGAEFLIPFVLVGPTGLYLIYASAVKGVFRAKNEIWAEMNRSTRDYQPARVNLINRTLMMAKALDIYMGQKTPAHPPIQPVLFFSDPGTHVDAVRPSVRIVLRDGLDRFVDSILQSQAVLSAEDVQNVVNGLSKLGADLGEQAQKKTKRDAFDFTEAAPKKPAGMPGTPKKLPETMPIPNVNLTGKQLKFLVIIGIVDILILFLFLALVIFVR